MKRRILFVEDIAILLLLYGMMLEDHAEWEIVTVASGEGALQLMATTTFNE